MKRFIFFFILLLTVSLTAVQAKTLVAYYSYTGNCKAITNALVNQITADVLEIEPAEKGLRYEANNYALGTQMLNAIKANPNDASSYPESDRNDPCGSRRRHFWHTFHEKRNSSQYFSRICPEWNDCCRGPKGCRDKGWKKVFGEVMVETMIIWNT